MAALEGKLHLLQIQRELSAVRCQGFIEMIQSTLRAEQEDAVGAAAEPAAKSAAKSAGAAESRSSRSSIEPLDRSRRESRKLFRHMSLDVDPTAVSQSWRDDLSFYIPKIPKGISTWGEWDTCGLPTPRQP
ncbi:hypothetical protein CLOM_g13679 [Closterium sp. NIES-68]|nr:hypothetical protein CLOM_g13679 [Closterium sp. NIES-68]